jgi:hypothetical protein
VKLGAVDAVAELAYRYVYRENSTHCRPDLAWRERIAELEAQLDVVGLARARADDGTPMDAAWTVLPVAIG